MHDQKTEGCNKGVHCEVESCYYNTNCCGCNAEVIDVGPTNACTCNETVCATFRQK